MSNINLLQRTLAHIEANPDTWDQETWATRTACGTAHCFAGHAVMLAHPNAAPVFDGAFTTSFVTIPDHPVRAIWWIPDLARDLLGLGRTTGDILFNATNTLEELRAMVADLAEDGDLERFMCDDDEDAEAVDAR
jgi:hypothetical protein